MRIYQTSDLDSLTENIRDYKADVVIVEGHDGAGKSHVVKELIKRLNIKVYRPDYGYWNKHISTKKRWAISAPFFELIELVGIKEPLLIDRCMVSGSVYEDDVSIAERLASFTENIRILHVLVTTDKESYDRMQLNRTDKPISYKEFSDWMHKFKKTLNQVWLPHIEFQNVYSAEIGEATSTTCGGCDNWSPKRQSYDSEHLLGHCSHWNKEFAETCLRCPYYAKESDLHEQL